MYLGIDSGGSKTVFLLIDDQRKSLARHECSGGGLAVEGDQILREISDELKGFLLANHQNSKLLAACVNLGGKNINQMRRTLETALNDVPFEVFRESGGVIPLAIAHKLEADIILLVGTGSIAIGQKDGKKFVSGGWGCNLGDEGSGYWISMQAIQRSLQSLERRYSATNLVKKIFGQYGEITAQDELQEIMDRRDHIRSIIPASRNQVAALVPVVKACAAIGDKVALEIFVKTGEHLADLVIATAQALALNNESFKVIITGGITHCIDYWEASFSLRLKTRMPQGQWMVSPIDLALGAALLAADMNNND